MLTNRLKNLMGIAGSLAAGAVMLTAGGPAHATVINLQSAGVTGTGSVFCGAGNAESVTVNAGGYTVVLSGGTPLGPGITNLPATASIAYGSADFANECDGQSGYTDPITIQFFKGGTSTPEDVNNFFINLYNGNTVNIDYTLEDNLGHGEMFNVGNNFSSGQQTFGFASAGSSFIIKGAISTTGCCSWDFFVNDIGFDQALPPGSQNGGTPIGSAPEPGTLALLGMGISALGLALGRRKSRV
jgi:hypothetical protein